MRRLLKVSWKQSWKQGCVCRFTLNTPAASCQTSPECSTGTSSATKRDDPPTSNINPSMVEGFISGMTGDLRLLQKQWMQNFRLCVTSEPIITVETRSSSADLWTPVVSLEVAKLQDNLVKAVGDALADTFSGLSTLDLRRRNEDVAMAQNEIEKRFPRLRLFTDHSRGTDLQGNVTHSVTVSLREKASTESLTLEEEAAKTSFFGESVGVSFFASFRRALHEAFAASGVPFPTQRDERERGVSELEIYLGIIQNAINAKISILTTFPEDDKVRINIESSSGRQLGTLDGKKADALSIALACVEKTAEILNSIATDEARKRIADHPVVLLLPSKGIRVKDVLRRLLHHSYGLAEEKVRIFTTQCRDSTFTATIEVELCWGSLTCSENNANLVSLVTAAGVNKKAAEELACVVALQRCFSRIFEDQLAYHVEIKEILMSTKATMKGSICPHISKGLLAQLRWAASEHHKKQVLIDSVQLLPNSENESLGIRTTKALWASQLFLIGKEGTRDLVSFALDPKKSTSEQKAIASALWKLFQNECCSGVDYAIAHNYIDKNGDPPSCEGIMPCVPISKSELDSAMESDPFLSNLRLTPSQPIVVPHQQSILSVYRRGVQLYVELLNERNGTEQRLLEHTERNPSDGNYTAQFFLESRDANAQGGPLGEVFSASTEIAAIFNAFKALFQENGIITEKSKEDIQILEVYSDTHQRVADLGSLPTELQASTPLETIAQCMMLKYGLTLDLHIVQGGKSFNVQIIGKSSNEDTPPFALGRGRGGTLLKSVISCCKHIFNLHIRQQNDIFADTIGEIVSTGVVPIPIMPGSIIALRLDDVMVELLGNKVVSSSAFIVAKVDVQTTQETMYKAHMHVVDGIRDVELEHTPLVNDLMTSLLHLMENIAREIHAPLNIVDIVKKGSGPSQIKTLEQLLKNVYGFHLVIDAVLREKQWHCYLSVPFGEDFYYTVGYAMNSKKKEAIEGAAIKAMHRCFRYFTENAEMHTACFSSEAEKRCGFLYKRLNTTSSFLSSHLSGE